MKNWLQKYDEHKIIVEIIGGMGIAWVIAMMSSHGFLQTPWKNFSQTRANYVVTQKAFMQKKSAATAEKMVSHSLKRWQKKHPHFYDAINQVTRDRSEILNTILQQSHLRMTHVESHHAISVQATGNFSEVLTLLAALNKNALPFTLAQLSINHVNQLKMQFATREMHVKK